MNILSWIILGLVVGTIAKSIMKADGGWISSLVTGVLGGLFGGWLGSLIFDHGLNGFFSLWTWVLSLGGAVLLLWLYGLIRKSK